MIILAIDCTTEYASVAVVRAVDVLAEEQLYSTDGFGHVLFAMVERALASAQVGLGDIGCFAAAAGPGSFTGVRVSLAAVKGLAEALGKPAVAVSNLRAVAYFGKTSARVPVIDARRGDAYTAEFDEQLLLTRAETVSPVSDLGDGELIAQNPEWLGAHTARPIIAAPKYLAAAIARCGRLELERGAASDPAALDAAYVRRSDAELFWHDK